MLFSSTNLVKLESIFPAKIFQLLELYLFRLINCKQSEIELLESYLFAKSDKFFNKEVKFPEITDVLVVI